MDCTLCTGCVYVLYMELDELDRRLLALLRVDGRAPLTGLASQLNVTRATVKTRLERLSDSGVVLGYTVRVHDANDPDHVRAVALIEVEGRSTTQVINELRGIPEIHALHTTNGGWDLVAELHMQTLGEFDLVLARIRSIEGVLNSETSLLLSSVLR